MGARVLSWQKRSLPSQTGQGTIDLSPVKKWLLRSPGSRPTSRQLLLSALLPVLQLHKHASPGWLALRDRGDGSGGGGETTAGVRQSVEVGRVQFEVSPTRDFSIGT